jgi:hypothetical protein
VARGLKLAGIEILRDSQKRVPVDLGTLKATGHVRHEGAGFACTVYVGYGTEYAAYVHEEIEKAHGQAYNLKYAAEIRAKARYWYRGGWRTYHKRRPGEQAKFLTDAVRAKEHEVVDIIIREAHR